MTDCAWAVVAAKDRMAAVVSGSRVRCQDLFTGASNSRRIWNLPFLEMADVNRRRG
jgi:hypothetical protein